MHRTAPSGHSAAPPRPGATGLGSEGEREAPHSRRQRFFPEASPRDHGTDLAGTGAWASRRPKFGRAMPAALPPPGNAPERGFALPPVFQVALLQPILELCGWWWRRVLWTEGAEGVLSSRSSRWERKKGGGQSSGPWWESLQVPNANPDGAGLAQRWALPLAAPPRTS